MVQWSTTAAGEFCEDDPVNAKVAFANGNVCRLTWLVVLIFVPATHRASAQSDAIWRSQRLRMVDVEIAKEGIANDTVLDALRAVPRHLFVPEAQRNRAYLDAVLPIGYKQTISPPFIVAYMTDVLDPQKDDKVLEIGTGSGYQAAVLAEICKEVYTIEIVEPLGKQAAERLKKLGYDKVHVKVGDGYKGWPEHAPFDKIIVTCSPESVPQARSTSSKTGPNDCPPGRAHISRCSCFREERRQAGTHETGSHLLCRHDRPGRTDARQRARRHSPPGQRRLRETYQFLAGQLVLQRQVTVSQEGARGNAFAQFFNTDPGRGSCLYQGCPPMAGR